MLVGHGASWTQHRQYLSRLTSPVAVKAAIAECDRLERDAFLATYGFKFSREYVLHVGRATYDSKAIAAVAFGYQFGIRALTNEECSGGRDRGNAAWALDRLGFHVTGIEHIGWWLDEVEPTVEAYFEMFALQRARTHYTKAAYLRMLHEENPRRTYKSYEYKMQNISAVLDELGQKWLSGFAPKLQYQTLLRYVIQDRLGTAREQVAPKLPRAAPRKQGPRLVNIDWAKRDAENRELGRGGEKYVFERERMRLIKAGKPKLAAKVAWNASEADGHGYDISSFAVSGKPIHIEVKTTACGKETPFFVSLNEVRTSQRLSKSYRLYRVFDFPRSPKIAKYRGPLSLCLALSPVSFRARRK